MTLQRRGGGWAPGEGTGPSSPPHPEVPSLHFQHLLNSFSNGKKRKKRPREGPRSSKRFSLLGALRLLAEWGSGRRAAGRARRDTESRAEFSITPSSRHGVCPWEGVPQDRGVSENPGAPASFSADPEPPTACPPSCRGSKGIPMHRGESEVGWACSAGREGRAPHA